MVDSKDLNSVATLAGWTAEHWAAHLVASKVAKRAESKVAYLVDSSVAESAAPMVGLSVRS